MSLSAIEELAKTAGRSMLSYFSQPSTEPLLTGSARVSAAAASSAQERASESWRNRCRHIWQVESPSAKVAEMDKFRCSDVPLRQGTALRLEPKSKFIIGTKDSDHLRLRLGLCVGKRRGSIHILR